METRYPPIVRVAVIPITLWVMVIFSTPLLAVDCSEQNFVQLTSQAEVDAFQANYGGGGTCDTLKAGLSIQGPDITSLAPLSALISVNWLEIGWFNSSLTNVDGLSNLISVGGHVYIGYNDMLTNLNGLTGLSSVGETLQISHNDAMTNIDGLFNLFSVGALVMIGNESLTALDGLSGLISVGGDVYITAHPSLSDCTGLSTLLDQIDDGDPGPGPGVAGIPDVGGNVTMERNLPGCNVVLFSNGFEEQILN